MSKLQLRLDPPISDKIPYYSCLTLDCKMSAEQKMEISACLKLPQWHAECLMWKVATSNLLAELMTSGTTDQHLPQQELRHNHCMALGKSAELLCWRSRRSHQGKQSHHILINIQGSRLIWKKELFVTCQVFILEASIFSFFLHWVQWNEVYLL